MRYISIDLIKPGMIIARTIFDESYRVLVGAGTPLSEIIVNKLREKGFSGIYINDKLSEDIIITETISAELQSKGLKALKELNVDASLDVAKKIAEQLLSSDDISLDMVDLRTFDDYTYRHCINVCVLSTIIGIGLGMNKNDLIDLSVAALLHDLGKLLIDPTILNKPGRLTDEEFDLIRQHSTVSYEYIKDHYAISSTTKAAVLYHHENEDGSGYPCQKKGNEVHIFAKIIHVADVYDALTSNRTYKKAYAVSEVVEYLLGGCDILFNREIVDVFLKSVPVFPKGTTISLSDGRTALVVENTDNPLRPKIRFDDGTNLNLNEDMSCQNLTISPVAQVELNFLDDMDIDHSILNKARTNQPLSGTILVVGLSLKEADQLDFILEHHYELLQIETAAQAMLYLYQNPLPHLILLDVELADASGIEIARAIRQEISTDVPLIFLSDCPNRETVLQCKEVQARDYIIKPFQPTYIKERISLALGIQIKQQN